MMDLLSTDLIRLQDSSWQEVVQAWKHKETREDVWAEHIKERGYKDWNDYRFGPRGTLSRYHFELLEPEILNWGLYDFENRNKGYRRIRTGPFKSWKQYGEEAMPPYFSQIVSHAMVQNNPDIQFTYNRLLDGDISFAIGLYEPELGVLSLLDGHHTLTGLNLMMLNGITPLPKLDLYLAKIPAPKKELFYDMLSWRIKPTPLS